MAVVTTSVAIAMVTGVANDQVPELRTKIKSVKLIQDNDDEEQTTWRVMPEINPDVLETTAGAVSFVSDIDSVTLTIDLWQSAPLNILTAEGDTAHVVVKRIAADVYETPDPALLKMSPTDMLSREQVQFDIDALMYTIMQVHPDIFSVCKQIDLLRAIKTAKETLPDSLTLAQEYKVIAPLVAMIGDGHTNLFFPERRVFLKNKERLMPVFVRVTSEGEILCKTSLDSIIPPESKILSINGVNADKIIESMLPYVSGERRSFRLSRIDNSFRALFHALYAAEKYDVEYLPRGAKQSLHHTFDQVAYDEARKRCPVYKKQQTAPYSFTIDEARNVAIMDFRSCEDEDRMEVFADSLFRTLRERNISNFIIDVRNNGGGGNGVGDIILKYVSSKPFTQVDRGLMKITPTTINLAGMTAMKTGIYYDEADSSWYTKPLTAEQGHYDGHVYVLSSNKTFSAAASFVWTFKESGAGIVVGEETGGMNVSYGEFVPYHMPVSKTPCSISYKRFWQMNADENDIHGALPDVAVKADDALDAALHIMGECN